MNQKNQIILLAVLLVILAMVWYFYFQSKPIVSAGTNVFSDAYPPMEVENPEPQTGILKEVQKAEYTKTVRNIFVATPPPPPPVKLTPAAIASAEAARHAPPPPPPPAQLPPTMKFFGYGTVPTSAARRAFLSDGDDVYIVGEGETLLGRFRILKIGNDRLDFEDSTTGQGGSAAVEQPGPSA
jgi:hypothetical protein